MKIILLYLIIFSIFGYPTIKNTDNIFEESLKEYKQGNYRKAMLGFMDIVIQDPSNEKAKEYLKKSGEMFLKIQEEENKKESRDILEDSQNFKNELKKLNEEKNNQIKEWEKIYKHTVELAENPDTLNEAILSYEYFLTKTPIFSDTKKSFVEKTTALKQVFYNTINSKYPYLVKGKNSIDEIDLATVFFAQSAINDMSYRYTDSTQTEQILAKSNKIKEEIAKIYKLFDEENLAMDYYSREKYANAKEKFNKVLSYNSENAEAKFYLNLANKYLSGTKLEKKEEPKKTEQYFAEILQAKPNLPQTKLEKPKETKTISEELLILNKKAEKKELKPKEKTSETPKSSSKSNIKNKEIPKKSETKKILASSKINKQKYNPKTANKNLKSEPLKEDDKEKLAEKLYEEGVFEYSSGNYKKAKEKWEGCLKLNPKHIKAQLGLTRLLSGKKEEL